MKTIELGDIHIDVENKNIKNIHLSVYPPNGRVRIAAPDQMDIETIRVFAISKLNWIKNQQETIRNQERESPREYINRESHYFWGKRYLLQLDNSEKHFKIELTHKFIRLTVRPNTSEDKRKEIIEGWYRSELKKAIPPLIQKWETKIGIQCNEFGIKKMRTKWGTCNIKAKRIWLNLELARKPKECLEYIIVHELVHLLERTHNDRFIRYMDDFMPKWRFYRDELNRLPFSHIDWEY